MYTWGTIKIPVWLKCLLNLYLRVHKIFWKQVSFYEQHETLKSLKLDGAYKENKAYKYFETYLPYMTEER